MKFLKYLWRNTAALIVFCNVIVPAFVFGATLISGWDDSFYYVFVVDGVILTVALIGDYIKFKDLL